MSARSLTEGARRAIDLAQRLAREQALAQPQAEQLLRALLSEESAAFERLQRHGFSLASLDQLQLSLLESRPPNDDSSLDDAVAALTREMEHVLSNLAGTPADERPAVGSWDELLAVARSQARLEGRGVEISTDHLLEALLRVTSPVKTLLADGGLQCDDDATDRTHAGESYAAPIAADFQIHWSDPTQNERTRTLRILDAAANRAREGLRVVEDFVRFTLDDAFLSRQLKELRHRLSTALRALDEFSLVSSRDTEADVGTTIRTRTELQRESLLDVAKANLKRIEEATRTLEEFSKVATAFDRSAEALQQLPEQLGQVRYQLYTIEKSILTAFNSRQRLEGANLYLLLTNSLCRHPWETVLREAITGGVRVVQVREKEMPDRELLAHARRVRQLTAELGALLIVNDRPDLAVLCDADGVHVGQDELPVGDARRIVGPDRLVGVSTHSIEQARQAVLDGANYIGVGPTFVSGTKQFDAFAGLNYVRQVAEEISLPAFAIGGIDASNVSEVVSAGVRRVAVSGAICRAERPLAAAAEIADRLMRSPVNCQSPQHAE